MDLRESLNRLIQNNEQIYSLVAVVNDVDELRRTIEATPIDNSADLFEVNLQAKTASEVGFVQIPTIGSLVVVTFLNKDSGFVSLCESVDRILIDTDSVVFNGGDNGGMVIAPELKKQIDKNTALLDAIQQAFSSWTPVSMDGGAALKALSSSFVSLQKADLSNIENDKIKH